MSNSPNKCQMLLVLLLLNTSIFNLAYASQKVSTALAEDLFFYPLQSTTAVANALNHAKVPAQISARVLSINVQKGNTVNKGQLLLTLDCQHNHILLQQSQAKLLSSQATLQLAERNYKRAVSLKEKNNIGEAELDNSQVNVSIYQQELKKNQAELAAATLAVEYCHVKSPFNGIVSERLVSEGDYVTTGQPIINVLESNNIEVEAQIPLSQLNSFIASSDYQFISNNQSYSLSLKNIVNFIEKNSRSQIATFSIENNAIISGSEGQVTWRATQTYLPAHLLTQRENSYGIFIIETSKTNANLENKATFIPVENAQEGRPFSIKLPNDTKIIIDGRHRVINNTAVIIVKN